MLNALKLLHKFRYGMYCMMLVVLLASGVQGLWISSEVSALTLMQRSLQIRDPAVSTVTEHTFRFSYASTAVPLGSVMFEYCTSPLLDVACNAPPGMDASGAMLTQQMGEVGFFILTAQTNRIILTRAMTAPPSSGQSEYTFDNVKNPDGPPGTFFARITTYSTPAATGPHTDFGAVVSSTADVLDVSTEVPPILKFCVGLVITGDCSSAGGNLVDLGDLKATNASAGTSQMQAATNAEFGVVIAAYGTTMTSGNNSIPALATPTVSAPGNPQFGINLRDNSDPDIGNDPSGAGIANPSGSYNIPDRYVFKSGDVIATSPAATDIRTFTVSYVANVAPAQPPGLYTATVTYICSASF